MQPSFALIESNTSGTGRLFALAARIAGFRPVLVSSDPSRYAYVGADGIDTVIANTDDSAHVSAVCKELRRSTELIGVLTSSDYFVGTAAAVAADLGLRGPDPMAVAACRDKAAQYEILEAASVPVPPTGEVSDVAAAVEAARVIGYPVVLKPVEGSGSIGVRQCSDEREVTRQAEAILARTHNERGTALRRRLLVQRRIDGPEFSVEVMFGATVGVTRKHLGPPPWNVEIGHDYPATLSVNNYRDLSQTAERAARGLGLTWGAIHVELRLSADGPYVIEVNPRLAGGFIPRLVELADDRDLIGELVSAAAGRPHSHVGSNARGAAAIRFIVAPRAGRFLDIAGMQRVSQLPGVVEVAAYPSAGAPVELRGDFRDRVGHVITAHETAAAAIATADVAASDLTVLIGERDVDAY